MDDLCYCDYEYPDVYRSESRKALIRHRCCACGRDIRPKETYEYVWGIWDGVRSIYKTCSHCVALRNYTIDNVPCFCWCYGGEGREDAMETLAEYAHEVPGLWFGGARLYVQARRLKLGKVKRKLT